MCYDRTMRLAEELRAKARELREEASRLELEADNLPARGPSGYEWASRLTIDDIREGLLPHQAVTEVSVDGHGLVVSITMENCYDRRIMETTGYAVSRVDTAMGKCVVRGDQYRAALFEARERWGDTGDAKITDWGFCLGVTDSSGRFRPIVRDEYSWLRAMSKPFTASVPTDAAPSPSTPIPQ